MYQHSTHTHKINYIRIQNRLSSTGGNLYLLIIWYSTNFSHPFPTRRFQETLVPSWLSSLPIFWVVPYCAVLKVPFFSEWKVGIKSFANREMSVLKKLGDPKDTQEQWSWWRSWSLFNQYEVYVCVCVSCFGLRRWICKCLEDFLCFYHFPTQYQLSKHIKSSATVTH